MKNKLISWFLMLSVMLSISQTAVSAEGCIDEIIYLEDGSYIEVVIEESQARATRSGSKTYTHRTSDGTARWKATLNATYTYDGSTSSCTSSSCSVVVYDDAWYLDSKYAYRSGNTAYASVTVGYMDAGVTISTTTHKISLSCDKNGNLS